MIDGTLNAAPGDGPIQWPSYPVDQITSWAEWKRFKAALVRWMEAQEQEWIEGLDTAALEEEHEDD